MASISANQIQMSSSRKTLAANDVFSALKDMLFEDMEDQLKESLDAFHSEKGKKESVTKEGSPTKTGAPRGRPKKNAAAKDDTSSNVEQSSTIEELIADNGVPLELVEETVE